MKTVQSTHTITWSRKYFNEYKAKYDKAVSAKDTCFINNGSCIDLWHGERFLKKFAPHFENKNIKEVTLKYEF